MVAADGLPRPLGWIQDPRAVYEVLAEVTINAHDAADIGFIITSYRWRPSINFLGILIHSTKVNWQKQSILNTRPSIVLGRLHHFMFRVF